MRSLRHVKLFRLGGIFPHGKDIETAVSKEILENPISYSKFVHSR